MKTRTAAAILAVLIVGCGQKAPEPRSDDEKTIYAIGIALSQNLGGFNLSEKELELVEVGLADGVRGKEKKVDLQAFMPKINQLAQARRAAAASTEKQSAEAFRAKAATEPGAKKTASGLVYTEVKAGSGDSPGSTDTVKVHYTGKLVDGTVFDSSVQRGEPATFALNGVIKCWTEGIQLMKVGGKATLVCPSDIAYGDQGRPPQIKPGATLVFDVELLEIVRK